MADRDEVQRRVFACLSFVLTVLMLILAHCTGIEPDYRTFGPLASVFLIPVVCWAYAHWRKMEAAKALCAFFLIAGLNSFAVLVYSYVSLRAALPLADGALAKADAALGIYVPSVIAFVDQSAVLSMLMLWSYDSIFFQYTLLAMVLAVLKQQGRACQLMAGHLLVCFISCTVSIFFPSIGTFSHYGIDVSELKHLNGGIAFQYHGSFFAARQDLIYTLKLGDASGVITFPSIHAATAIMCAWGAWTIRAIKYPMLVLNGLMLASTIPVGAHYGIDVAFGSLIALGAIAVVRGRPLQMADWGLQKFADLRATRGHSHSPKTT